MKKINKPVIAKLIIDQMILNVLGKGEVMFNLTAISKVGFLAS